MGPLETKKIAGLASCSPNAGAHPYLELLKQSFLRQLITIVLFLKEKSFKVDD